MATDTMRPTGKFFFALTTFALATLVASGCALASRPQAQPAQPTSLVTQVTAPPAQTNPGIATSLPDIQMVTTTVRPAVVSVTTQEMSLDSFLRPVQESGAGSGVIFDKQGLILTNNHVVANARNIRVTLPDGRNFDKTTVVGRDARTDLAVLKLDGVTAQTDLPVAKLGSSQGVHIGEWVIAVGNALGLDGGPTVTAGVVGALGRSIQESTGSILDNLIQTDAAINPGNSGGPLINLRGEVIGINTAIDSRGQGIGFAINIESAQPIITQLVQSGRVIRPALGVRVATMTPNIAGQLRIPMTPGVVIANVQANGPAAKAGLKATDIVTKLDNAKVATLQELMTVLEKKRPGDRVDVTYLRNQQEQKVTITLDELPLDQ